MPKEISSLQNPLVKRILSLKEKAKRRYQEGLFVVEGQRELNLAKQGGFNIRTICYLSDEFEENSILDYDTGKTEFIKISQQVYEKLAYRSSTEGILGLVQMRSNALKDLKIDLNNPLILVAESPEKPGNIGALLRTADAVNATAVLIADSSTDLFNPNVIRSSVGGLFTIPVATGTTNEIIDFLNHNNIAIFSAILQDSASYDQIDFRGPSAIVVGPESTGLSKIWRTSAKNCIHIPMLGILDSMNVSVAAGIILYEAKRQRKFL